MVIPNWRKPLPTLIIDADGPLYQAMTNAEKEVEWEDDVWSLICDHKEALVSFNDRIAYLKDLAKADKVILCFSDKGNFRKEVYPLYKMNRKALRKPVGFKEFRAALIEDQKGFVKPDLEADDCVGILATKLSDTIIFSDDKDLMQIPGKHLIDGEIVEVTEEEGDTFHLKQTLMGDPTDGYPGCPGIGKVKADKLLSTLSDPVARWLAIVDTYASAGLTEEDALVQARVARILRVSDWDGEAQKPILWTPVK